MSIQRALRRGGNGHMDDAQIGAATVRIYKLLWEGQYVDAVGRRRPVRGDISKITQIIGLSSTEKAIL